MAQRLSNTQKTIYEAHKEAYLADTFTLESASDLADLIKQIRDGKTSFDLWDGIALRRVSITSQIYARTLNVVTGAMERDMKKGFLDWLVANGIE